MKACVVGSVESRPMPRHREDGYIYAACRSASMSVYHREDRYIYIDADRHAAFMHGRRCVEGRVREGDVSPAQCEKLLQRLSYEWPDWERRIRAGLGGGRVGGGGQAEGGLVSALVARLSRRQVP